MKRKKSRSTLSKWVAELVEYVRHTNEFGNVKRLIWRPGSPSGEVGRERNDSHVGQLMDVAWFVRDRFLPHLDLLKLWKYCMVHDKPEVYAGDTPAFPDPNNGTHSPTRETKKERERVATEQLRKEWGERFPDFLEHLDLYERQVDEESRLVYALDKLLSELNIYEDRGRSNQVLCITRDASIAYKYQRIASHPLILELYKELLELTTYQHDLFFQPTGEHGAVE